MPLTEEDIREILRLIDESEVEELRVETDGFSLYVRRGDAAAPGSGETPEAESAVTPELPTISAPIVGTFYRAPEPGAPPFVDVGARVEPETIVCIIEVMKMMNAIPAGVTGTIAEVCVENAKPVEFGTPLFRVEPG